MKALPNRLVIDVKFRRWTLVSQWPVLAHEWVWRGSGEPGVWPMLRSFARASFVATLLVAINFGTLYATFWLTAPIELVFGSEDAHAWSAFILAMAGIGSTNFSVESGKPIGLFWVAALLERATRLDEAR